jgi:hypothetical protein
LLGRFAFLFACRGFTHGAGEHMRDRKNRERAGLLTLGGSFDVGHRGESGWSVDAGALVCFFLVFAFGHGPVEDQVGRVRPECERVWRGEGKRVSSGSRCGRKGVCRLTVQDVLLVLSAALVIKLVRFAYEFLDLVFQFEFERGDLFEDDAEFDEVGDDARGGFGLDEGLGREFEGEEGDEVLQVREQEVVLEREERDAGGIVQLVRLGASIRGQQAVSTQALSNNL